MRTSVVALLWILVVILLLLALSQTGVSFVYAQATSADLLALVNEARINQGLYPYVISAELSAAAQRHSNDMATSGQIGHTGSDGSSSTQRVLEAGYGVFDFGLVASENVYGGIGGADAPFNAWMGQSGARSNLLSEKYREVGIGVARDDQGRIFWTLDVGARPNVLPVLINDGVTSVDTISVTLTLVRENVVPQGQGTAMGQPIAYRASTNPEYSNAEWRSWADKVPFLLENKSGRQTVYVQLRDAADRTAVSQASVTLGDVDLTVTPTLTEEPELPDAPTVSSTATVSQTPTPLTSPTRSQTPTRTATATIIPTQTPGASDTPRPTMTLLPSGTPIPTATRSSVPVPTFTLTLTPSPTSPVPLQVTAVTSMPTDLLTSSEESKDQTENGNAMAPQLAPWAVGLEIVALILGVYLALRRPDSRYVTDASASGIDQET
jgi:hypothetical protein